jgi:putative sterol carrier protein
MINEQIKESLNEKIQDGEFDVADIPAYLTLFCEMGNEVEDLQDEVEDWNRRIVFDMDGLGKYWIVVEDGQFSTGAGDLDDANVTLTISAIDAAQVFAGDKDAKAAYMSGSLKVDGDLPDAVKVQTLIEIVAEEIEY